ncbi:expressed unknown protein [Seminavis robusta]|uniref:Uncharacterized protein n=1 Tax=Seminavis robusta TaxID=568900 RepID=A0A9N8DQ05_9STRA|nr:expressed unknown protein [Seminavis robusta]|eukprot:Sro289_g108980.1 n/a (298) ;mRNA; r:9624-10517
MIDIACLFAACLFVVGQSLSVTYMVKLQQKQFFDYAEFTVLDPDYIQQDWQFRRENQALEIAGGFINAFSWLFFSIPMIQLAIVLSRGGTRLLSTHMFIGVLVISGCAMEFFARFMHLGIIQWGNWLSLEYNLQHWVSPTSNDNIGWRTLEVSHLISFGTVIWIDSFEFLCLGFALVLVYASVNSLPADGPRISRSLAGFALFIGLFSLADFVSGVLRLRDWSTFRVLTMLISIINRLVLLPIFLLCLGCQLPYAVHQHKEAVEAGANTQRSRHWVDSQSTPSNDTGVELVSQPGED